MFGRVSVAVMIAMVVVPFEHMLLGVFSLKAALKGIPYAYSCASYAFDILAIVILIRMIGGVAFARQWQAVGMSTFDRAGETATAKRPLAWLSMEFHARTPMAELRLTMWPGGEMRTLAYCHPHGAVIKWVDGSATPSLPR